MDIIFAKSRASMITFYHNGVEILLKKKTNVFKKYIIVILRFCMNKKHLTFHKYMVLIFKYFNNV